MNQTTLLALWLQAPAKTDASLDLLQKGRKVSKKEDPHISFTRGVLTSQRWHIFMKAKGGAVGGDQHVDSSCPLLGRS